MYVLEKALITCELPMVLCILCQIICAMLICQNVHIWEKLYSSSYKWNKWTYMIWDIDNVYIKNKWKHGILIWESKRINNWNKEELLWIKPDQKETSSWWLTAVASNFCPY